MPNKNMKRRTTRRPLRAFTVTVDWTEMHGNTFTVEAATADAAEQVARDLVLRNATLKGTVYDTELRGSSVAPKAVAA